MSEDRTVRLTDEGSITKTYRETSLKVRKNGSTTHVMTNDGEDLKIKVARAEYAVTDLIDFALDKAAYTVKNKTSELLKSGAFEPGYAAAKKDSAIIGRLGHRVTDLAITFEGTITRIREHSYDEQVQLLKGYKKLLEEQVNIIDSRIDFVKRLR